ncbi:MAG: histidinol-phosphate transaminase [Candidatus Altiarchaeales archaeon IMC4]|nr:MAG: histidinol-phosphate transaminase [Candidatus Altiarchaeales archaeon IMC4]
MTTTMIKDKINPRVRNLPAYVAGVQREGTIRLMSNENNYGASQRVMRAVEKANINLYTDPTYFELCKKIADYCGVKPENIIPANGSDEAMDFIGKVFLCEGDEVLSVSPTFSMYRIVAMMYGAKYNEVPLEADFSFDAERFIGSINENTKLVFLANPNNPTGTQIDRKDIKNILKSTDALVVIDEAYAEFSGESVADLAGEYKNLIVTRTFSKAFGLAGARLGYIIWGSAQTQIINLVRQPWNISSFTNAAGISALGDVRYMQGCVGKIRSDRKRMADALKKSGFGVFPSGANFLFVDVSPMSSDSFFDKMLENKIVVRKFGKIAGFGGDYVRITVGTTEETDKFISALGSLR